MPAATANRRARVVAIHLKYGHGPGSDFPCDHPSREASRAHVRRYPHSCPCGVAGRLATQITGEPSTQTIAKFAFNASYVPAATMRAAVSSQAFG